MSLNIIPCLLIIIHLVSLEPLYKNKIKFLNIIYLNLKLTLEFKNQLIIYKQNHIYENLK